MPKTQGTCIIEGCTNKQAARGDGSFRAVCNACRKAKKSPFKDKAPDPNSNNSKKKAEWKKHKGIDPLKKEARHLNNTHSYQSFLKANE